MKNFGESGLIFVRAPQLTAALRLSRERGQAEETHSHLLHKRGVQEQHGPEPHVRRLCDADWMDPVIDQEVAAAPGDRKEGVRVELREIQRDLQFRSEGRVPLLTARDSSRTVLCHIAVSTTSYSSRLTYRRATVVPNVQVRQPFSFPKKCRKGSCDPSVCVWSTGFPLVVW